MPENDLDVAGDSDIGRKRNENQDHFLIADLRRQLVVRQSDVLQSDEPEMFGCCEGNLLVVADGMGGHSGGERASRTAVEATAHYVLDMMRWFLKLSVSEEQDFLDELAHCLELIQDQLWSMADSDDRKMGTTVTMAYLLGRKMYVVHAGDSRCYILRGNELKQLTTDHTIAQQLIDSGSISEEEAQISKWRHVLWNCVGGGDRVRPEAIRTTLQPDDIVLLCSDGLTGMLSNEEIQSILARKGSSKAIVRELVAHANDAGGKDNITTVVCRFNNLNDCDEIAENGTVRRSDAD